jgi:hypothetical protein
VIGCLFALVQQEERAGATPEREGRRDFLPAQGRQERAENAGKK